MFDSATLWERMEPILSTGHHDKQGALQNVDALVTPAGHSECFAHADAIGTFTWN